MSNKRILLYVAILTIVSGCGFIEELRRPTSFPKVYVGSFHEVDGIIGEDPLTEGEDHRITYVAETRTATVRIVQVRKDAEIGAHTHNYQDEVVFQLKGSGIAILGGVKYPVKPGTALLIPMGTPHSFVNNGTEHSAALSFLTLTPEGKLPKKGKQAVLPIVSNLDEIPREIPQGEEIKTIELGRSRLTSLHLEIIRDDTEGTLHCHKRNDTVMCVVAGSGIVILDDTRHIANPGSIMISPRKSYHKYLNTGGKTYVELSIYSPPYTGKGTKYILEVSSKVRGKPRGSRPEQQKLRE